MAINSVATVIEYDCDGATTRFPITFTYLADANIIVKHYDDSTQTLSDLANPAGYEVVSDEVETVATYPIDDKIFITLDMDFMQESDLEPNGKIGADVLDLIHDKLTLMCQQLRLETDSVIGLEVPEPDADMDLPNASLRASRYLAFDSLGNATVVSSVDVGTVTISTYGETVVAAANADALQTLADVYSTTEVDSEIEDTIAIIKRHTVVSSDTTLVANTAYLATGDNELTLPTTATVGDSIGIISDGVSEIIQNDAEQSMTYKDEYTTTTGVTGYVLMSNKDSLNLTYKGAAIEGIQTSQKLANPAVLPSDNSNCTSFSSDGTYLAVGNSTTPFITIYKRSGDTFTKLTNPTTLPTGHPRGCAFSPDDVYLAIFHDDTPFITIYKRSGDTFTKLTNPSTLPTGTGYGGAFSTDGTYLAVAHNISPFITIYKRSSDTFTKLTNPSTLPTGFGQGCSFSADGTYLAVAHGVSPYITIYKRSVDTFTKLTNPLTLPASSGLDCSFGADGVYLAVSHVNTPYITIYKRSTDTFTKLTDPTDLPPDDGACCSFTSDGTYLAVAHDLTPYITIYKRSSDTFAEVSSFSDLPTGDAGGCDFVGDRTYLAVAHGVSPYVTIYKTLTNIGKQWIVTDFNIDNYSAAFN